MAFCLKTERPGPPAYHAGRLSRDRDPHLLAGRHDMKSPQTGELHRYVAVVVVERLVIQPVRAEHSLDESLAPFEALLIRQRRTLLGAGDRALCWMRHDPRAAPGHAVSTARGYGEGW